MARPRAKPAATFGGGGKVEGIRRGADATITAAAEGVTGTVDNHVLDPIAFVSYRDGNDEVYVMNADGTGQTRLTAPATTTCSRRGRRTQRGSPSAATASAPAATTS